MTESHKTVLERLSEASVSDDLSHSVRRITDVDCIGALGMAGAGRSQADGSALMRLDLTLDRQSLGPAIRAAQSITRRIGLHHGWQLTPRKIRVIASEALAQYLHAVCRTCSGRGMVGVDRDKAGKEQRPRPCPTCSGSNSSKRPLPQRYQREIRAVLYEMEKSRREVGASVRKRLRVRADVE